MMLISICWKAVIGVVIFLLCIAVPIFVIDILLESDKKWAKILSWILVGLGLLFALTWVYYAFVEILC